MAPIPVAEWAEDDPRRRITVDQMLRMVDALQFNEEHGEVCPANWSKGDDAMTPTAEGVAKYLSDHK